jgi:branched-chain amino acid transport system substrate-binding protein
LTEIRFGWFGPTNLQDRLTGDLWWAANFAVDEANASGPAPPDSPLPIRPSALPSLPFRLVPRWAVDPWGTGVAQLTRMVYSEQPLALLGSVDSATTHLAEQITAKANLPLVSPIATDASVTLAGVPWMFSCAPGDPVIARVLVDSILATSASSTAAGSVTAPMATPTGTKLALFAGTDHESRMTARAVLREFSRRGRAPDFRFDVPPGASDLARHLSALEAAQPDIVLVIAGPEDAARLVRAIRAAGGKPSSTGPAPAFASGEADRHHRPAGPVVFGSHALSRVRFLELAGPAAEGVRFPMLFAPGPTDAVAARFIEAFGRSRGHAPDYTAALVYDATRLLLEAARRAGPNRARLREALVQLSPWSGVAGVVCFDGTGQNTRRNLGMGTIRNGTVLPL